MVSRRLKSNILAQVFGVLASIVVFGLSSIGDRGFVFIFVGGIVGPLIGGIVSGIFIYEGDYWMITALYTVLVETVAIVSFFLYDIFDDVIEWAPWAFAVIAGFALAGTGIGYIIPNSRRDKEFEEELQIEEVENL